MASRKNLLSVDYHYDDDTGMYDIGEIDTGVSAELTTYLERYGRKGLHDILDALEYLAEEVRKEAEELEELD